MRILVAQTAYLGDAVLTTPLLRALKRTFPGSHLTLLCRPAAAALLEGLPYVDAFLHDRKKEIGPIPSAFELRNPIRQGHFDAAVAAHRSARTAVLLACSGAPLRVGFEKSALGIVYHRLAPDPRHEPGFPAAKRYLELMRGFGKDPGCFDPAPEVPVQNEALERMRGLLRREGWEEGRPLAVLCHGSEWETKKWTEQGYAELAADLQRRGMAVALAADRADMSRGDRIAASAGVPIINLTGRTSLKELAALLSLADLAVANDSAPAHIASALGRPLVVIFGPTHSSQGFAPQHPASQAAEHPDLYCRPCGRHGAKRCPEVHFRCMRELSVQDVLAKAEEAMAQAQWKSAQERK